MPLPHCRLVQRAVTGHHVGDRLPQLPVRRFEILGDLMKMCSLCGICMFTPGLSLLDARCWLAAFI